MTVAVLRRNEADHNRMICQCNDCGHEFGVEEKVFVECKKEVICPRCSDARWRWNWSRRPDGVYACSGEHYRSNDCDWFRVSGSAEDFYYDIIKERESKTGVRRLLDLEEHIVCKQCDNPELKGTHTCRPQPKSTKKTEVSIDARCGARVITEQIDLSTHHKFSICEGAVMPVKWNDGYPTAYKCTACGRETSLTPDYKDCRCPRCLVPAAG